MPGPDRHRADERHDGRGLGSRCRATRRHRGWLSDARSTSGQILVSSKLAKSEHWALGQTLSGRFATKPVLVDIGGIYTNDQLLGGLVLPRALYDAAVPAPQRTDFAIAVVTQRRQDSVRGASRPRADHQPVRRGVGQDQGGVHQGPAGPAEHPAVHPLRPARSGRDHRDLRDHQHPGAVGVRADPRDRAAPSGGDGAAPAPPGDPAGVRGDLALRRADGRWSWGSSSASRSSRRPRTTASPSCRSRTAAWWSSWSWLPWPASSRRSGRPGGRRSSTY